MMYECVRCRGRWGEFDKNNDDGFLSHGLCKDCLRDSLTLLYRKRQRKEGNPDCFAKASDYCDQFACCYRYVCLRA
jgi:hypothetical protein